MTCDLENTTESAARAEGALSALTDFLPLLTSGQSGERFRGALEMLLNLAMLVERQQHLQAAPYERADGRNGHANGFKDKALRSRLGDLNLRVPQVRGSSEPFYPKSLEKGLRSERALKLALAEMYVQGVSTRKVAAITEQLCGFEVTSAQVSRASAELDAQIEAWRNRPLGETPYLILDARYEKVRQGGVVRKAAVLIAIGIGSDGKRQILGVSVSLSEHEVHWREFLRGLVARGLSGVRLIVSDSHEGLGAARQAVFGSIPWHPSQRSCEQGQRCQFHLQQNAQAYVPKQEMKSQVAADLRAIFDAPDQRTAEDLLRKAVVRYQATAPKLARWMEENVPQGLTVFSAIGHEYAAHRRRLRTTNGLERVNKEVKRRTRVATLFPSEASCLRLVSAVLMEISDEWEAGKAYLTF
jgi:putative transposase